MNTVHSQFNCPFLNPTDQRFDNFRIINKVQPAKTEVFIAPFMFVLGYMNGSHASNNPPILICQPISGFGICKGWIFIRPKRIQLIRKQTWNIIRIVFIQGKRIADKLF